MLVSRPVILVDHRDRAAPSAMAAFISSIETGFLRLPSKQAFQFLHRASCRNDVEFPFSHFDEFNAISGVNPQRDSDPCRYW